ncbi:MAG: acetyltransferase [Bryobacteraceae bacterium]
MGLLRWTIPLTALLCWAAAAAWGQVLLGGSSTDGQVRLIPTDLAVLELREPRNDLPCAVMPDKPALGFDLRLHSGYTVTVPLQELAGRGGLLSILFRVTPLDGQPRPVYFIQRMRVPPIEEDARGQVQLEGSFDLGEGRYRVDWLMRDQMERVCASFWEIEASLNDNDRSISLVLPPGQVSETEREFFTEEPPVERIQGERLLNVKVLVNFAPDRPDAAAMRPQDIRALVSILRALSREPRIGSFSLVAFNLHEQRVLYRQQMGTRIDFPALGQAVESMNPGTVSVRQLSERNPETQFLAELVREELSSGGTDAVIFTGAKTLLDQNVPGEALRAIGNIDYPVFYLNYIWNPQEVPWRDAIGNIVRFFRGAEYTISRPRDLWRAIGDIVSRITEASNQRLAVSAAGR